MNYWHDNGNNDLPVVENTMDVDTIEMNPAKTDEHLRFRLDGEIEP